MSVFNEFFLIYEESVKKNYPKLSSLPGFVLLQSADKQRGRYDILSAYPYEQFRVNAGDESHFFEILQEKVPLQASTHPLPFQGGAIGFFSYDFANQLAFISNPIAQPGLRDLPLCMIGLYDWALIVDHVEKKITVFSANTRPETADIVQHIIQRWNHSQTNSHPSLLIDPLSPLISYDDYADAFYNVKRALKQGRCYQVNLTQPYYAPYQGSCWELFERMNLVNPVAYSAYMALEDFTLLCFSPERFLRKEGSSLLSSPIKGTAKRSPNPIFDAQRMKALQQCSKNRAENVMIVDLLRNDLSRVSEPGSVMVRDLFSIETYASLHHLVSHIEAQSQSHLNPWEIFRTCFPGGSITGAPKIEAMKLISELEHYARGVYCGSIGYFSRHGHFDTNIAIRTLVASPNTLHFSAGGAIVMDSRCEQEYEECTTKVNSFLTANPN